MSKNIIIRFDDNHYYTILTTSEAQRSAMWALDTVVQDSIAGRPNFGKLTFLNYFLPACSGWYPGENSFPLVLIVKGNS